MRCLRCALDYGPEERYCQRCGRALSKPPGTDKGDSGRFSALQDTQYLYSTHSPPTIGDTPQVIEPAEHAPSPGRVAGESPYGIHRPLGPLAAGEYPDVATGEAEMPDQRDEAPFRMRLRRLQETPTQNDDTAGSAPDERDILPWSESARIALLDEDDDGDWPPGFRVRPIAIGADGDLPRHSGRNPNRILLAAAVAAVLLLAAGFGFSRYRAHSQQQHAAPTLQPTAIPTLGVDPAVLTMRLSMFRARSAQRQSVAQQADADARATATAVAQATAAALAQATANARAAATQDAAATAAVVAAHGTSTAIAALHATASTQAQATAAVANATVVRLAPGGTSPVIYAAIGASDGVGLGATNPASENWAADLARNLPSGSQLINLGKSGALLSYGLQQEMPQAIAAHPDLVTVWMAVNDLNARVQPATYSQQLDTLIATLRSQTHAAIYVGNVPDLTLLPLYRSIDKAQLTALILAYNQAIAQVVAARKATLIDLYGESQRTIPAHPEYVSADGFHPSTAGYADLAGYWWGIIHSGH